MIKTWKQSKRQFTLTSLKSTFEALQIDPDSLVKPVCPVRKLSRNKKKVVKNFTTAKLTTIFKKWPM